MQTIKQNKRTYLPPEGNKKTPEKLNTYKTKKNKNKRHKTAITIQKVFEDGEPRILYIK